MKTPLNSIGQKKWSHSFQTPSREVKSISEGWRASPQQLMIQLMRVCLNSIKCKPKSTRRHWDLWSRKKLCKARATIINLLLRQLRRAGTNLKSTSIQSQTPKMELMKSTRAWKTWIWAEKDSERRLWNLIQLSSIKWLSEMILSVRQRTRC